MLISHSKSGNISQGNITQVENVEKRKDSTTYIREAKKRRKSQDRKGQEGTGAWATLPLTSRERRTAVKGHQILQSLERLSTYDGN